MINSGLFWEKLIFTINSFQKYLWGVCCVPGFTPQSKGTTKESMGKAPWNIPGTHRSIIKGRDEAKLCKRTARIWRRKTLAIGEPWKQKPTGPFTWVLDMSVVWCGCGRHHNVRRTFGEHQAVSKDQRDLIREFLFHIKWDSSPSSSAHLDREGSLSSWSPLSVCGDAALRSARARSANLTAPCVETRSAGRPWALSVL